MPVCIISLKIFKIFMLFFFERHFSKPADTQQPSTTRSDSDSSSTKHLPRLLKSSQVGKAEEPRNKPGGAENNSTDSLSGKKTPHHPDTGVQQLQMFSSCSCSSEDWDNRWEMRDTGLSSVEAHLLHNRGSEVQPCTVSITHHPLLLSSLHCHHSASQEKQRALPKDHFFFFFGWDKMLLPARWNLATVCLLAVTEFKNSALLSGNVVSRLPDRPNSVFLGDTIILPAIRTINSNTIQTTIYHVECFIAQKPLAISGQVRMSPAIIKHVLHDGWRKREQWLQTPRHY